MPSLAFILCISYVVTPAKIQRNYCRKSGKHVKHTAGILFLSNMRDIFAQLSLSWALLGRQSFGVATEGDAVKSLHSPHGMQGGVKHTEFVTLMHHWPLGHWLATSPDRQLKDGHHTWRQIYSVRWKSNTSTSVLKTTLYFYIFDKIMAMNCTGVQVIVPSLQVQLRQPSLQVCPSAYCCRSRTQALFQIPSSEITAVTLCQRFTCMQLFFILDKNQNVS